MSDLSDMINAWADEASGAADKVAGQKRETSVLEQHQINRKAPARVKAAEATARKSLKLVD